MNVSNNYKKIILIVSMISMAGVTFGITMPLSTLTLKSWGISSTMIGLNSAMPALSAVLTTPFMPKFINYWGQKNVIRFCLVLVATCCICLPLFPDLFSWFILRFLLGAGGTGIWLLSEVWINGFAEDHNRGKIIGAYSALLSLGFIVGVLMFSVIGVESNTAFYLAAGFVLIAAIPVWTMSDLPTNEMAEDISMWNHMVLSPGLMGSSWMMGFLYAATAYLLPIFALQFDLNYAQSSRTIAWLGSGELAMPLFVGWFADKIDKRKLMIFIALVTIATLSIMPFVFEAPFMRLATLFVLGGAIMSFYSLGLTILGQKFKGSLLASANASFIFFLCLGEIIGPPVIGTAMDLFGTFAFGWSMALFTLIYLVIFISTGSRTEMQSS
jgi:MFS family permease